MQLNAGYAEEYRRRHDDLWPELATLLKQAGISDYSIFLDEKTHTLFAVLWRKSDHTMDELPLEPVMQRWWAYMQDIMVTEENNEPVVHSLEQVFHFQ